MMELLKSGRINNRLLCEIATHENFVTLMADTEIYVILSQYQSVEEDTALKVLETMHRCMKTIISARSPIGHGMPSFTHLLIFVQIKKHPQMVIRITLHTTNSCQLPNAIK